MTRRDPDRAFRTFDRYECTRSTQWNFYLICYQGEFENLPQAIRSLGPWFGGREGDVSRLKPEYRAQLARRGFCIVDSAAPGFSPEH